MQDYFTKILNYFSIDIKNILRHLKKLILFEIYRKITTELPHNAWFQVRLGWVKLGYPTMQDYFTKKTYIVR